MRLSPRIGATQLAAFEESVMMKSYWKRPPDEAANAPGLTPLDHVNDSGEPPKSAVELSSENNKPEVETLQGKRIDVTREDQLQYWSTYFGVTPAELRQAVRVVGPWARAVSAHLK
jgi:hypothetical protein